MIAKINITDKDLNAHPELRELVGEVPKPEKPKPRQSIPLEIEYDDAGFWHKPHVLKRWLLIPLIVLAIVGACYVGYQVYLHWLWVSIGTVVVTLIIIAIKVRTNRNA